MGMLVLLFLTLNKRNNLLITEDSMPFFLRLFFTQLLLAKLEQVIILDIVKGFAVETDYHRNNLTRSQLFFLLLLTSTHVFVYL